MSKEKKVTVSVTTVIIATVVVFLAGFCGAVLALGLDVTIGFGDSAGSRADWIAAIGTWMIGIAATFMAWITFLHGRDQTNSARTRMLQGTQLVIADAIALEICINQFLNSDSSSQTWGDFSETLQRLRECSQPIRIEPSALPYISHAANRMLVAINLRLRGFRSLIEQELFHFSNEKNPDHVGEEVLEGLRQLLTYVEQVDKDCIEFVQALKSEVTT